MSCQHIIDGIRPARWWGCSRRLLSELREEQSAYLTPVLFPPQAVGMMAGLTESLKKAGCRVYLFREKFSPYSQVVAYSTPEQKKVVQESIKEEYGQLRVCKVIAMDKSSGYKDAKKGLEKLWEKQEGRLSLYEALNREKHTWQIFSYWLADESLVEPDVIVMIWERYLKIRLEPEEVEPEDLPLDFLGDDWW